MDNGLLDKIQQDLERALKERNLDVVRTLRFLLSAIHNLEIEKYPPEKGGVPSSGLPDEDVTAVLAKMAKTHRESIEAFKTGQRADLVKKEEEELSLLQKYLPEALSEEAIKKLVIEAKERGLNDFGQIMKDVMAKVKGQADGSVVSKVVKEVLGG